MGSRIIVSQYLFACYDIIIESGESSVLILSRGNFLPYGLTLNEFSQKLKSCLPSNIRSRFNNDIRVTTAHASKGQEADVVIILRTVNGQLPLVHPDGELFRIFGLTMQDILDEGRRLFYVACSRAKKHLFLLAEKGELSDFVPKHITEGTTGYTSSSKSVHRHKEATRDTGLDDEIPF